MQRGKLIPDGTLEFVAISLLRVSLLPALFAIGRAAIFAAILATRHALASRLPS